MRALTTSAAALLAGCASGGAFAHPLDVGMDEHLPAWSWDPLTITLLAVSAALFAAGWSRLNARSTNGARSLTRRAGFFASGWLVLALAVLSPLHEAGERSFAAHMVEHELIMLFAAPLLVAGEPLAVMLWAFPRAWRQAIGQGVLSRPVSAFWARSTTPLTATLFQAAVLWGWHAPAPFDLALASEGWHVAQHLSFLVSALLFWSAMLGRRGAQSTAVGARSVAALCLFVTSVVSGALGALMAFSPSPWYLGYARLGLAAFGLSPTEDQQLAGLLMWIPGGLVHALAALLLLRTVLTPDLTERPLGDAR